MSAAPHAHPKPQPGPAVQRQARALPGFEARVAQALAVLRAAAERHPQAIVQATSLGAEDMVITDLIARHRLPVAVATLDTGALHDQTLALLPRIQARYGLAVERWAPPAKRVLQFVAARGARVMYESLQGRQDCCALRKLEPLARLLAGRSAWVTGLRREHSGARSAVGHVETEADPATGQPGREKINPLADWAWADVWHYIGLHDVPYNPLHDDFFPSIGCAPCTRAVALGEDFRAGRWWWEQAGAKECGLHVQALGTTKPVRPETPDQTVQETTR